MTTLAGFRDAYQELSGTASEVSRKLGFAAIAVIWIFKADLPQKTYALPPELFMAGFLVVCSLGLDLFQYFFGSLIFSWFCRKKENENVADDVEFDAPRWFNWPSLTCFWIKLVVMIGAYIYLLSFLGRHIAPN